MNPTQSDYFEQLKTRIDQKSAVVGVIGLGYVGLPLAVTCCNAGFSTIGFDIDTDKITTLNLGNSYIDAVKSDDLEQVINLDRFRASDYFSQFEQCDILIICVPTPLTTDRNPDLQFVTTTTRDIVRYLRPGQMIVLESTTYPGTTEEVLLPILQSGGFNSEAEFFLGYSPEREDPGNEKFDTASTPKIVAGHGKKASLLVEQFYANVVKQVVVVSSLATAEAVKISENVFRAVNIALANELKLIYDGLDIDIWEVIDAAATKPFGYMPFYPGPGLGGHCIPIDPFYLAWKAKQIGMRTRFIELAGEINVSMPAHIISKLVLELETKFSSSLAGANILIVGLAYKKNVPDIRESPSLILMELLENECANTEYFDPLVPTIPMTREHSGLEGRNSIELSAKNIANSDAVLIATDHDIVDYALIAEHAHLIIDTRNCFARREIFCDTIVKA